MSLEITTNRAVKAALCSVLWCSIWALPADAQQLQWNRRVKAVALIPTPGAPGGVYDVYVEWVVRAPNATPMSTPQNLNTLVEVRRNGSVLSITTAPASIDPPSGLCFDCMGECPGLSCGSMNGGQDELHCDYDADCLDQDVICECPDGGPEIDCVCEGQPDSCFPDCAPDLPLLAGVPANPGDEIAIILYPAPGALPDPDTSDNSRTVVLPDAAGVLWNRRVAELTVEPSAGGTDSFFDIWVGIEAGSNGIDHFVDLSTIMEIQINGVPAHTQQLNSYHYPTPCSGPTPPPGGNCTAANCGTVLDGASGSAALQCAADCSGSGAACFCACKGLDLVSVPHVGPLQVGDEITVILRPAPGALPELPGMEGDDSDNAEIGACRSTADCADLDGNGIRDSNCIWWECDSNAACNATFIPFADMGGSFGACPPDFTTDSHDRFHVLNCFADLDTTGVPGYPCEEAPPQAMNVDASGLFGACSPDGVCDGNDVFAVLNTFAGISTCSCAMSPAPDHGAVPPQVLEQASLMLIPSRENIAPGDVVDLDVYVASALQDLRGYQLHVGVDGGTRGALNLIDMSIGQHGIFAPASDLAAPAAGTWAAFNVNTQQMVAGADGPGVAVKPLSYLATFTLAAGHDARGTFTVNLLHDDSDPGQRTFLFPTAPDGKIEIRDAAPAVITVGGRAQISSRKHN